MSIGDSITAGYTDNPNWNVDFNHGYRSGLYTQLTNAGYDIQMVGGSTEPYDNAFPGDPLRGGTHTPAIDLAAIGQDGHRGYGGKATPFFLPRMQDTATRPGLLSVDNPDVVLIHLGTNGRFTTELDTMLQGIFDARPDVGIVLAKIIPKAVYQPETVVYNDFLENTLIPKYQGLGAKIRLADHYTPFLTDPADPSSINLSLMATGNHPNGAGYDVMAGVWFAAVENLLAPTAAGDFNGDGFVNSSDYLAWRSSFGLTGDLAADANGDGLVDAADYTVWRDAANTATQSVPEPTTLGLIACCVGAFVRDPQR